MRNEDHILREKQFGADYFSTLPVVLARGEGILVWDVENNRYLDLIGAYSGLTHGHCHPRLVRTLKNQAHKISICSRICHHDQLAPFLKKLCAITQLEKAFLMNSGAEAIDSALKVARRFGYDIKGIGENQGEIIVMEGAFHGRTMAATSLSTQDIQKRGFGPFLPGIRFVPFGDLQALEKAITPQTAAILTEPILGEAGIIIPPKGWLQGVRSLCDRHKVLLMVDEIQSGLGRCGDWLCCHQEGVNPDIVILGKSLGGGLLPVSAVVGKAQYIDLLTKGSHGSTIAGSPLACAIGLEALLVLEEENLLENSKTLGQWFVETFVSLNLPGIKDVRGRGLWIGIETDPAVFKASDLCLRLLKKGLLAKETRGTIIRLAPPLVITKTALETALELLAQGIREEAGAN